MIVVGMIVAIVGILIITAGIVSMRGLKIPTILYGCLVMLSGVLIGAGQDLWVIIVGFSLLGVAILILVVVFKKVFNNSEQYQYEHIGEVPLDCFFVECVLAKVDDFSVEKNRLKAQLLADKYKLEYPNGIEKLYQQGLEGHKVVTARMELEKFEAKRLAERQEYNRLNKYSNLTGRDKRIAMLSDRAYELREKAKSQDALADMYQRSGKPKEISWATMGGIAEGLGGIGAGISMAVDCQLQNMKIREESERRQQALLPVYLSVSKSAAGNRQNADKIMAEIEQVKLKLISDYGAEELIQKINFSHTDVLVSSTGAATVCTLASLDPEFKIFEDVDAVVDGTIIAQIYDEKQLCGTAEMVLPLYGVGENVPLKGMCLDGFTSGKTYTVMFSAKHLWAMETTKERPLSADEEKYWQAICEQAEVGRMYTISEIKELTPLLKNMHNSDYVALISRLYRLGHLELTGSGRYKVKVKNRKYVKRNDLLLPLDEQNEKIKQTIYEHMDVERLYTIEQLKSEIPELKDLSDKKVEDMVRQLYVGDHLQKIDGVYYKVK